MSTIPPTNTPVSPGDNLSLWTQKYPALLTKNFIGVARIWDKQFPPATNELFPFRNMPFNFSWRVNIDPAMMAPYVGEGADTPMSDAETKLESFVCQEARLGGKISLREINFGIGNVVQTRVGHLVNAVNLTRLWSNITTLVGINVQQPLALARLNTFQAGTATGGSAVSWNDSGAKIIEDLLHAKTLILKKSGAMAGRVYIPLNEYEALHNDSNILDQLKYTDGTLLVSGRLTMIKGLAIRVVPNFWKERKKDGSEVKHFVLEDQVIVTAGRLGFTAVAEPRGGSAPMMERWYERAKRSIIMHAFSSFTTVVEDYGLACVITDTDKNLTATPTS